HGEPRLSLSLVAVQTGLSRWHLCRMLKLSTGMGFADHLRIVRLRAAAKMLADPTLRVKEIAFAVGYKHVSSFDRDFRDHYRMTPTEFVLRANPDWGNGD